MSILLILLTFLTVCARGADGYIHGTIVDPSGAVIPNTEARVYSATHSCNTRTGGDGQFHCKLPPDTYTVLTSGSFFVPYRRAAVTLRSGAQLHLKLAPVLRTTPVGIDFPVEGAKFSDPVILYEIRAVQGTEIVVQHMQAVTRQNRIEFSGPHLALTADALSVLADSLSCVPSFDSCTGSGHVVVELGEEPARGSSVDIDFVAGKLVLTREPKIEMSLPNRNGDGN
jgi:Carboxypeptidase regulatory-like domain